MAVLQCCVWLFTEMRLSRAVFDLNDRKSGVNRHLRFCQFPKSSEVCSLGWVLFIKAWHHSLHISELKYAHTHGTFPSFLETDKTAGAYSHQIYNNLSQIQRETNAFLQIFRHNTEGPPFSDWQWRGRTLFFFVGLKNRVNLVLFFKPSALLSIQKLCTAFNNLPPTPYTILSSFLKPFPNPLTPRMHLSHLLDTFHKPALRQPLGPCIIHLWRTHIPHSFPCDSMYDLHRCWNQYTRTCIQYA